MNLMTPTSLDLRADFPGLSGDWRYLDTAATAQKPQAVIDAIATGYGEQFKAPDEHAGAKILQKPYTSTNMDRVIGEVLKEV